MNERRFQAELEATPAEALNLLSETVDSWGGKLERDPTRNGGRLGLPVRAGLRSGWVAGPVDAEATGSGSCQLQFAVEVEEYRVDKAAFGVLALAAAGALTTVFAPLVPRLIPLVPVGILLAVGAWLFIVARLRNSGPEELFALLDGAVVGPDVVDPEVAGSENAAAPETGRETEPETERDTLRRR